MAAASTVKVTFLGDAAQLNRVAKDVESKTSSMGDKMAKFGKMAAAATLAAGAGLAYAGKAAFNHGAELEAMGNKAATVFGDQIDTVAKWAQANASGMGLSSREAVGLAASFGDLLIPMGFTRDEAAKMSTDVVGLSGALSQWSGGTVSAAGASDILAKAMLGERDGLKSLGISISDADVQARLLKNGTDELTGSALEQAKATATQQLIFEKSTDAQAAYEEGGNKLLTAQNTLKAKLKELYDEISVRLIPVFTAVAEWAATNLPGALATLGGALSTVGEAIKSVTTFFREHETTAKTVAGVVVAAATAMAAAATIAAVQSVAAWFSVATSATAAGTASTKSAAQVVVGWTVTAAKATASAVVQVAAWVAIGVAAMVNGAKIAAGWLLALGPIGLGIIAFAAIAAAIVFAWKRSETFRDIVTGAFKKVLEAVDAFLAGIQRMLQALAGVKGFGWADEAAQKVGRARSAVQGLADSIGKVQSKTVTVTVITKEVMQSEANRDATKARNHGARAHGGPVMPGRSYVVGEHGPEVIVPKAAGTVLDAGRSARMMGGGPTYLLQLHGTLDASINERTIQETFRRMELLAGTGG